MKIGNEDVKLYLGSAEVEKIYLGTEQVYGGEPTPVPYSGQYLTIESLESDNRIYFKSGFIMGKTISASTDNGTTWVERTSSSLGSGTTIATLGTGGKVLLKGLNSSYQGEKLTSSKSFNVYGNIMSMISGDSFSNADTIISGNTFESFFYGCSGMTSAENLILPATTLAEYCYSTMFEDCTSLTIAPELPATTLANGCYQSMFQGCTSLTTAPELPATTLAEGCYSSMFNGCTSLTTAPELPATILSIDCYSNMFLNCTSLNYIKCLATDISAIGCTEDWVNGVAVDGTFVKAESMYDWTDGESGIPYGWTVQNDEKINSK